MRHSASIDGTRRELADASPATTARAWIDIAGLNADLRELRRELADVRRGQRTRMAVLVAALGVVIPARGDALVIDTQDIAPSQAIDADAMVARFDAISAAVTALEAVTVAAAAIDMVCTDTECVADELGQTVSVEVPDGRYVRLEMIGTDGDAPGSSLPGSISIESAGTATAQLRLERSTDGGPWQTATISHLQRGESVGAAATITWPASSFAYVDEVAAGTHEYRMVFVDMHPEGLTVIRAEGVRLAATVMGPVL